MSTLKKLMIGLCTAAMVAVAAPPALVAPANAANWNQVQRYGNRRYRQGYRTGQRYGHSYSGWRQPSYRSYRGNWGWRAPYRYRYGANGVFVGPFGVYWR